MPSSTQPQVNPPLEERFYSLTPDALEFFKLQTGIENDDDLKRHILTIQKKAYDIYGLRCLYYLSFLKLQMCKNPAYPAVLELSRIREDSILLELGCFVGTDARKVVADGWPAQNHIICDLRQGFWNLGHEVFKSTPESFRTTFLAGDVLDLAFLPPGDLLTELPQTPRPTLRALTSLAKVKGHISAIFTNMFFHLFSEEDQLDLARRLASTLSPLPGSTIFGMHIVLPEKGHRGRNDMFYHSLESWRELWEDKVFKGIPIKVETQLETSDCDIYGNTSIGDVELFLVWSVVRL